MKKGYAICFTGAISFVTGFFLGGKALVGMINDYKRRMERNASNLMLFNDWLEFLYAGGSIEQYFHEHGYKRVMLYGNGYIGQRLFQALEKTDVEVTAIMDQANSSDSDAEGILIGVDSEIPDFDCVVVTPTAYFDEIFHMLRKRTGQSVISVEELWQRQV
ncbi:MAG: hypothetical protein K2K90_01065 [Lachnospiraceae bacterium]|nr:hypothetical protein [Lachnospiraceae bacterium]